MAATSAAPAPAAFELRDVVQRRGDRMLLDHVDLELPAGRRIALIGPSGAGKSTLLRLLNRLDEPAAGTLLHRGVALASVPVRALRRRVAMVFQAPVMFEGTIAANLAAAAAVEERAAAAFTARVAELLAQAGLPPDSGARDVEGLSGGEKQRVALARALASRPEVLLLDEPTAALDPEVAAHLIATLHALHAAQPALTLVMVSHRLAEARALCDWAVMMEAGRVVEAGPAADVLWRPAQARTRKFLGAAAEGTAEAQRHVEDDGR